MRDVFAACPSSLVVLVGRLGSWRDSVSYSWADWGGGVVVR